MGYLANGWNNVVDNNSGKTLGGQIIFKPTGALSIVQNYMAGPEQPDDSDDWRQISDTTVTFTATEALTLMANYDYGHDTFAGVGGHWQGFAGYAKIPGERVHRHHSRFECTTTRLDSRRHATDVEGSDDHAGSQGARQPVLADSVPRRLLRSGRFQEQRWRLQGSAALHRHRYAVFVQLQGEIARTGLASVRYSPMATLRPKPSPAVLLDAARRELSDEIVRGEGGRVALERYCGPPGCPHRTARRRRATLGRQVAIAALGGYGRRQLCLHSDIDLLVLFDGPLDAADESGSCDALLHPLWDLGLVVGHQVRELDDFAGSRPTTRSSCSR